MSGLNVLFVAGTHGNEVNAPWVFDQWNSHPNLIQTYGLNLSTIIGNPIAREKGKRYIDRDLNRSFSERLFLSSNDYEVGRAKELLDLYGPNGRRPCQIVIDFHSTTSCMGCCLVVYGRRFADLALASLLQSRLGLPIYLYEGDASQQGFLVESWPCGLVIEIGPVPQGLLHHNIVRKTLTSLQFCIEEIHKAQADIINLPDKILVHRHLKSMDFPRDSLGNQRAFVHPKLQDKDWLPISYGDPLFQTFDGHDITFIEGSDSELIIPVFINEAAYIEKGIAMSLTLKESWDFKKKWYIHLKEILSRNYE